MKGEKMNRIGIVYGSTTGVTAEVAQTIQTLLGKERADLMDVSAITVEDLNRYQNLILGVSTWGMGEMQNDWEAKLKLLKEADLKGKRIALFGLGDQIAYADTYLDAMGTLYDTLLSCGVTPVGQWPADGYACEKSTALRENRFVGLALDEDNESKKTAERIDSWLKQLDGQWL
jgi:flavodoxin I